MSESPANAVGSATNDLFDKYTLPKIALGVILAASLLGTAVSVRLTGWWAPVMTLLKWSYFVALGVLAGGLVWKHGFVRPGDLDADAGEYCAAMYDRFDRIAGSAVLVGSVGGVGVLTEYYSTFGAEPRVAALGTLLAVTGTAVLASVWRSASVDAAFRSALGLIALSGALLAVVATAVLEASLRGAAPIAVAVRVLHLLAFSLWIGGAVWNIFVAVPTGQARATVEVVRVAGQQLERFRWAVRFIIPTLLLTGLYQAVDVFGTNADLYLGTAVGLAVLAKAGTIGLLAVIFKLCPMWRACSPIDGVCDLEQVGSAPGDASEVSNDD